MKSDSVLRDRLQTGFLGIIAFSLLMFVLVQARFTLIALVIAVIIFSLTSDAIGAIARQRVPNWLASVVALMLISLGVLWAATMFVAQVNRIVYSAIIYAEQIQEALPGLLDWMGPDALSTVEAAIANINVTGWIRSLAGQASNLMSAAVLIILFVGFMFAERAFMPLKIERLTGDHEAAVHVSRIAASIMRRVNRYLVVKAGVSTVTAAGVWMVFRTAGLDLAEPIAMITFILNFIPSVGSIVATLIAILIAFVQTADSSATMLVGVACGLIQFFIGNILDPMLLGQTLRLSSFGIIISLAFWGAVWGIPGMFLAVPIMVAIMIICAQIPWLRPVAVMLSREGLPDDGITEPIDN